MSLIGMLQPSQVITENARQAEKLKQQRYEKQLNFQRQYEDLLLEAKERIRMERSALMEENIRIEIRNWIDSYFQQTGKIPDLPSAESGGSRMIFSRQVIQHFEIEHFENASILTFWQAYFILIILVYYLFVGNREYRE